jgi:hypothetical protein
MRPIRRAWLGRREQSEIGSRQRVSGISGAEADLTEALLLVEDGSDPELAGPGVPRWNA